MLQLVEYRIKWIVKNNHAIKIRVPIYKDVGKGAGLEKPKKGKQDQEKNVTIE